MEAAAESTKPARTRRTRKTAAAPTDAAAPSDAAAPTDAAAPAEPAVPVDAPAPTKRTRSRKKAAAAEPAPEAESVAESAVRAGSVPGLTFQAPALQFRAPDGESDSQPEQPARSRRRTQAAAEQSADSGAKRSRTASKSTKRAQADDPEQAPPGDAKGAKKAAAKTAPKQGTQAAPKQAAKAATKQAAKASTKQAAAEDERAAEDGVDLVEEIEELGEGRRRRRRRGGRGRRSRGRDGDQTTADAEDRDAADSDVHSAASAEADTEGEATQPGDATESASTRRRRRRRRRGNGEGAEESAPDDPERTVVRLREPRRADSEVASVKGSTRLEAKKQRRREGREAGRRRVPIISEAEFLARRESVERVMVVRQIGARTQIAVLEDGVLVEHYVNRESTGSLIGNVYLGKVQNVLPSMEAAFVDIGKGRNAVLYAGEVNFDVAALEGAPKRIENVLKSGQSVLVQVTKDPIAHKGARLTSQISLPGRYLVYVPEGSMTGISRKLPDTERNRLKNVLRKIVPEDAGVIVRTAAEGASEDELSRDVVRLTAQWEDITAKAKTASAPALLYGEPDLTIRVVRDIFNEDFSKVIVSGADAWETVEAYVGHVAPDLVDRLQRWTGEEDLFAAKRIDEQLFKALDRKVWLPSGGSLIIDRTEAMTVIDVNTGKFTGQGGNLEETVTKNNLEAAEEIVRQLRLRDIGGIIVIDFIDMVLESNRELVLRRLLECLGRDRTKHQVAEVTSLGLVQMTRKRVGQGLLEAFSEPCEVCNGRGVRIHLEPLEPPAAKAATASAEPATGRSRRRDRGRSSEAVPAAAELVTDSAAEPEDADAEAAVSEGEQSPVAAGLGWPA
ncbi:MAG TPA: Rne/Rng family ribonuclease [Actinomycetes bacterium]|nr:Rne/Rng family ribonuclease [Actinomycetes bacterium]